MTDPMLIDYISCNRMDLETQLRNVCSSLHDNNMTVSTFIHGLLDMHPQLSFLAQETLLSAADICAELYRCESMTQSIYFPGCWGLYK